MLTCVPLHGFQRSTAAALCDLTTEVLRTINATENAMVEYGLAQAHERSHLVGTDVKQADDAFRELEENVRSNHELHVVFCLKHDRGLLQSPTGLSICGTNWFLFGSSSSKRTSSCCHGQIESMSTCFIGTERKEKTARQKCCHLWIG